MSRKRSTYTAEFKLAAASMVTDLFSRMVVGRSMAESIGSQLVIDALTMTMDRRCLTRVAILAYLKVFCNCVRRHSSLGGFVPG